MNQTKNDLLEALVNETYKQKFGRELKMPSIEKIEAYANTIPQCNYCENYGKALPCRHSLCNDAECKTKHDREHRRY